MNTQLPQTIADELNLIEDSRTHLLLVVFAKSTSQNYKLAVNIAQSAAKYQEMLINGKPVHFAAFEKSRNGAAQASTLLEYVHGWNSTQVFAGGKLFQNSWHIREVLSCYIAASACSDWRAYCLRVIDDPSRERARQFTVMSIQIRMPGEIPVQPEEPPPPPDKYLFPCRMVQSRYIVNPSHPSSIRDQIEANAIEFGCDWCPKFDADNFRKIEQNDG